MDGDVASSRWAAAQFGEHAAKVARDVAAGLVRAQRSARVVQEMAQREGAGDRRAYGSMWALRYNFVVEQLRLADLPGYRAHKPKGASYSLAVVNGRVLIPFRHATSLNVPIDRAKLPNKIPRQVSRENGVPPAPTLFDLPSGEETPAGPTEPTVAEAAAAAEAENLVVVYVAFVANADSDEVLAAWWGTPVSLEDDGTMVWSPERLDLSVGAAKAADGRRADLRMTGTDSTAAGFAQGDLPPLSVTPRAEPAPLPSAEADNEATRVAQDGDE
ncbi:hypothetical protein I6A60_32230 [Frankia sp. AgB1.9]|uniref:hypothetical protein n=1 Tax=unclassified Frankia TaxID=2632575 RepID=UPI0019325C6C|nr:MULTISPECIES: hypothetical protein [unclassified Frankia]MBL7491520.1 hypothetical protein [Frankia sp. AgW1.1]MBL7552493.1 hypothetical protein [Frankia sp. AgB1.9]MBL7622108.1 hypothetical protein [Frankia sp. AgB1.8]